MNENSIPEIELSLDRPQLDLSLDGKDMDISATNEIVEVANASPSVSSPSVSSVTDTSQDTTTASDDDDVNDIVVSDKSSPIIMLFGPRSSGKSMTLVRLARYLRSKGYTIKTDFTFRSDPDYRKKCDEFEKNLDTRDALPGNAYTDFLLLKVSKQGRTICQFLEAPGEHYFDPEKIGAENFPPYMTEIIRTLKNRKIWVFIAEAKWYVNPKTRAAYVGRIRKCKDVLVKPKDRFIILYNKIDQRDELFRNGRIIPKAAERTMREEYDGLADAFKNNNPTTSLWRDCDYSFVPFCTGYYSMSGNKLKYTPSEDHYPAKLWKRLLKCIKG